MTPSIVFNCFAIAVVPPENITVIDRKTDSLDIGWSKVVSAESYNVNVVTVQKTSAKVYSKNVNETTIKIPGLKSGTQYDVRIQAARGNDIGQIGSKILSTCKC